MKVFNSFRPFSFYRLKQADKSGRVLCSAGSGVDRIVLEPCHTDQRRNLLNDVLPHVNNWHTDDTDATDKHR